MQSCCNSDSRPKNLAAIAVVLADAPQAEAPKNTGANLEYLASNQVVGGSNLSGRAKVIKHLTRFRKFESSNKNKNINVLERGKTDVIF